jgi:hypothetical protein
VEQALEKALAAAPFRRSCTRMSSTTPFYCAGGVAGAGDCDRSGAALSELIGRGLLKDADALVLDLREGWGGAVPDYLDLFNARADAVVPHRISIGPSTTSPRGLCRARVWD